MTAQPPPAPQPEGWFASIVAAVRSLTFTNVAVIIVLVLVAIPAFAAYTLLTDPTVMDRFLSSYSEVTDEETGCTIRTVRMRGGPWRWSIAAGFAMQRSDRWSISVVLPSEPDADAVRSYCATLDLIVKQMLFDDGGRVAP